MYRELARYYDELYSWKNYGNEAKTLHAIVKKYKKSTGSDLLDVACGTGNHVGFLRKNYHVFGVDLNPAMLSIARKKFPGVPFKAADMASFKLGKKFDVVVCLFSSIAYLKKLEKVRKAFACFSCHIKKGGVLIVEPFFEPRFFKDGRPFALFVNKPNLKIARMDVSKKKKKVAILDFHFLVANPNGVQYFRDKHEVGLFEPKEVIKALQENGFRAKYLRKGFMAHRGLYVGIKE